MWLGAASLGEPRNRCVRVHTRGNGTVCGPVLDSLCTAALVRCAYSRLAGFRPLAFWRCLRPKDGARNGSNLEGTSRALPRPFFVPGNSRILEDANLRDHLCVLLCYARRATRQQIAFSPVCIIALNAPKRLSPQKRRGCTAELQLWQCSPCGGHTCRTTRARYRGASRSHRAAAHAIKCSPSRKTRATRTH